MRRKGVHIVRHMLPFWRGDEATIESFIEAWMGGEDG